MEQALTARPKLSATTVHLTWNTDKTFTIQRPRLDPAFGSCLTEAFFRVSHDPPLQPVAFVVHLDPTPYPQR